MIYRRLFDLEVRHDWFSGGPCLDLQIAPKPGSPAGARALARHRLLSRPRPGGLEICGPLDADSLPLIPYDGLTLGFDLVVSGPDFPDYTDLADWHGPGLPTYRNKPDRSLTLHPGPLARPAGVSAAIEIADITAAWLSDPPSFRVTLPARRPHWVYYLLTARPGDLAPQILDGEPERGLAFERLLLTPEVLADDLVGRRLLARNPGRRCFRFTSAQPIACRRAPLRQLALHLGDEQLVRELPSPDIHSHATLKVAPEGAPTDSLFRVLEY